ncbi:MAG: LysR family transcriptional regulator [Bermanella sp.]
MLDISDIQMITTITELGSINRASEALNVSQPTLSKRLTRLEKKLRIELFHRDSVGMIPTQAAKFLIDSGQKLQYQMHIIERQLDLMANLEGVKINLGVGPIVEQLLLPKVLLDFVEQSHTFKISVVTESPQALLKSLRTGEIDIAIGPFDRESVSDEFKLSLSSSESLVCAVRKDHELSKLKSSVTPKQIFSYPSITPNIPIQLGNQLQELIEHVALEPNIICDNYAMAKNIVVNSNYVTAGPESLFRKEFDSGELMKLELPVNVMWQCYCIAKPEVLLMPAVKELVSIFSQYMDAE